MTSFRFGSATDVGLVRANNQDHYLVADPLFAVADGMGGHAAGEVASATAVEALKQAFRDRTAAGLATAARAANQAVWDQGQAAAEMRGMGTTLVALALVGEPGAEQLAVANVGDSRLYRLRDSELVQVTTDHSLVGELVAEGTITPEEAEIHPRRHVLTRALGVDPDVAVDLLTVELHQGDRFLLCSDGLSREVTDDQVASVLRRLEDPQEVAKELVSRANEHGGNDNVTVVVVDVVDDGGKAPAPESDGVVPSAPVTVATGLVGVDEPTTAVQITSEASERSPGRWARRRARRAAEPRARLITLRVIGFFVLLILVLLAVGGGAAYYARDSYYVGLKGKQLVVYQGRPGGVLWFEPTIAERPGVTTSGVLPVHLAELRAGKVEPSLSAAEQYVRNIHKEYLVAKSADNVPSTTVPSTTVPTLPPTTLGSTTTLAGGAATTAPPTTGGSIGSTAPPAATPTTVAAATP